MSSSVEPQIARRRIPPLVAYNLRRAVVSLPEHMCTRNRPLQERTLFYELPSFFHLQPRPDIGRHLEQMLALVWGENTTGWCDAGYIYNDYSSQELLDRACDAGDSELYLFEIGVGLNCGIGAQQIGYARRADCDFFVKPTLAARLTAISNEIEARYTAHGSATLSALLATMRAHKAREDAERRTTGDPDKHISEQLAAKDLERADYQRALRRLEGAVISGTNPLPTFNPFTSFAEMPQQAITLLEEAARMRLTERQRKLATSSAMAAARADEPISLNRLIAAWKPRRELRDFVFALEGGPA